MGCLDKMYNKCPILKSTSQTFKSILDGFYYHIIGSLSGRNVKRTYMVTKEDESQ